MHLSHGTWVAPPRRQRTGLGLGKREAEERMFDPGLFVVVTGSGHCSTTQSIRRFVGRYRATAIRTPVRAEQELRESDGWMGMLIAEDVVESTIFELLEVARGRSPMIPVAIMLSDAGAAKIPAHVERLMAPLQPTQLTHFIQHAIAQEMIPCRASVDALVAFALRHNLTIRESEVLSAAIAGIDRQTYLEATGIAENTRKRQVRSLLRKCGHSGVERAAISVLREGVLRAARNFPEAAADGRAAVAL